MKSPQISLLGEFFLHSQPSISMGSTPKDSTSHRQEVTCERIASDLNMYRIILVIIPYIIQCNNHLHSIYI